MPSTPIPVYRPEARAVDGQDSVFGNESTDTQPSVATPRPWHTGGIFNPDSDEPSTSVWGPTTPGMQSGVCIARPVGLADAAFIVHSVNLHDELVAALAAAIRIAEEARLEWDAAPSGMRAGKLLIALAGHIKHYRPDIDAIHAALAKAVPQTVAGTDATTSNTDTTTNT